MQDLPRALPNPDPSTEPFWEAARQGKLVIQRCRTCGTYYHPPLPECLRCRDAGAQSDLAFEQVSGYGSIYSYVHIHTTRVKGFEKVTPYPVVFVELDEQPGLILSVNMPGVKRQDLRMGARVEAVFIDIGQGFMLPEFHLATS